MTTNVQKTKWHLSGYVSVCVCVCIHKHIFNEKEAIWDNRRIGRVEEGSNGSNECNYISI